MLGLLGNVTYCMPATRVMRILCVCLRGRTLLLRAILFLCTVRLAIITNLVCTWLAVKTESLNVCAIYKLSDC